MKKKERDIRYKTWSFRLANETIQLLRLKRSESGLTWNQFIIEILKK